jgi:hypothetical protein
VTGATSNAGGTTYGVVAGGTNDGGNLGGTGYWPAHVLYRNRAMTDKYWPNYGYTGPAGTDYQQEFTSSQYSKLFAVGPSSPNGRQIAWPDLGYTGVGLTGGGTASTIIRNIDKFYSIYQGSTGNYDDGWGDPNFQSKASEFRFKRINSEFALVDFNITIAVRNPNLQTGIAPGETGTSAVSDNQSELIDRGSPRWTQFMRLKYFPSANDPTNYTRNQFLYDLFGNGLAFSNWSSYKNWYSGWAVVGDDNSDGVLSTTATGDSFYMKNDASGANASNFFNRWNGNLINYGMTWYWQQGTSGIVFLPRASAVNTTGTSTEFEESVFTWIDARKSTNKFLYSQSLRLIANPDSASDRRQTWFQSYLGATFQLMGNRAFSRNRSCAWRLVPQFGNYYQDLNGATPSSVGSVNRNSFALEIMFDDPIMHHDAPLENVMFEEVAAGAASSKSYYKYLTVSGQSMVRYSNDYTKEWNNTPIPAGPGQVV